jgi:hypothetical protein
VIANLAEGLSDEPVTHEGTLRDAARAAGDLARLIEAAAPGLVEP